MTRYRGPIQGVVVALLLLLAGAASYALAQASLGVGEHEEHGEYLIDAEGLALYVYLPDEGQEGSACLADCARAWPPLTTDGAVDSAAGVDAELVGTIEREDGSEQVTYAGRPLYRYIADRAPGASAGQGMGDTWFLIGPGGDPLGAPANEAGDDEGQEGDASAEDSTDSPEEVDAATMETLMADGESVYARNCASCHGENGDEALASHAVELAGNDRAVSDASRVIRQIVYGGAYMPAFGNALSDHDVAAVATFVRNAWGNDHGAITEAEVVEVREQFE